MAAGDRERLRALLESNPSEALKLINELNRKRMIPHAGGQDQVMASTARFLILDAGRRWGKTEVGAARAIRQCRKHEQMVWWVAPTYKVVKRGYRKVLQQLDKRLLTHEPPQDSAFDAGRSVILKFKNGSRMEFYSAERPEGMLGEGVDFAVLDEAAIMPKNIWEQIVRPTLMDRQGGALMISTPRGRNWFYYMWLRGQDPDHADYQSWKFTTRDNPYIADEEVEEMEESMPLIIYQQEVLAEFIASAGSVFRFDHDIIVPRVEPKGHVYVGVDLAKTTDFTVFEAANADTGAPCGYDRFNDVSWPMQRNRLKSFVRKLRKAGATHVSIVMDSTGVGDPFVDDLEADGYDVVGINFTKTKQHMVMQLAKDLEDGLVRIGPERIEEIENYTYKVTDKGRFTYSAPEGQHDDVVSALMLRHWGIVQEGAPNLTAISVDDALEADDVDAGAEESGYEPDEDWSDLLDDNVDTGKPEFTEVRADSAASIMARASAWS